MHARNQIWNPVTHTTYVFPTVRFSHLRKGQNVAWNFQVKENSDDEFAKFYQDRVECVYHVVEVHPTEVLIRCFQTHACTIREYTISQEYLFSQAVHFYNGSPLVPAIKASCHRCKEDWSWCRVLGNQVRLCVSCALRPNQAEYTSTLPVLEIDPGRTLAQCLAVYEKYSQQR